MIRFTIFYLIHFCSILYRVMSYSFTFDYQTVLTCGEYAYGKINTNSFSNFVFKRTKKFTIFKGCRKKIVPCQSISKTVGIRLVLAFCFARFKFKSMKIVNNNETKRRLTRNSEIFKKFRRKRFVSFS